VLFTQYVIRITNGKRDGLLAYLLRKKESLVQFIIHLLHSQKQMDADSRYKEEDFPATNQV
jgi:hypothetical protein